MRKKYPTEPTKNDIEKIARDIVIEIHTGGGEPDDAYEKIHETGWNDNLKETLLKKMNIMGFLHDYEGADGDSRDVGSPPLELAKLFESVPEDGEKTVHVGGPDSPVQGTMSVKRKTLVIPPDQVRDALSLASNPIGADTPEVEDEAGKVPTPVIDEDKTAADDVVSVFDTYSDEKLAAAIRSLKLDNTELAAGYVGHVRELSYKIASDQELCTEMARVHHDSVVTRDTFKAAGIELPEPPDAKWLVARDTKLASYIAEVEKLAAGVDDGVEMQDILEEILASRTHEGD